MRLRTFLGYLGWLSTFGSLWAAIIISSRGEQFSLGLFIFTFCFSLAVAFAATNVYLPRKRNDDGEEEG